MPGKNDESIAEQALQWTLQGTEESATKEHLKNRS